MITYYVFYEAQGKSHGLSPWRVLRVVMEKDNFNKITAQKDKHFATGRLRLYAHYFEKHLIQTMENKVRGWVLNATKTLAESG